MRFTLVFESSRSSFADLFIDVFGDRHEAHHCVNVFWSCSSWESFSSNFPSTIFAWNEVTVCIAWERVYRVKSNFSEICGVRAYDFSEIKTLSLQWILITEHLFAVVFFLYNLTHSAVTGFKVEWKYFGKVYDGSLKSSLLWLILFHIFISTAFHCVHRKLVVAQICSGRSRWVIVSKYCSTLGEEKWHSSNWT